MNSPVEKPSLVSTLRAFHDDEDGMETLQTVMIVGIAVVILLLLVVFWKDIKGWFDKIRGKWKSDQPTAE